MSKSIKMNYLYNLLYQITSILMPMITIPYVSRVLKPEGIGISSYVGANIQYFTLIGTLGISLYANRTIAMVRDDKEKLIKTFWEIEILQIIGCTLSFICFYFVIAKNSLLYFYYMIQSIALLSSAIDISWYFVGIEDFKKASLRSFYIKLLSVMSIFIFVKSENDLWKYILINTGSIFLGQLVMWFFIGKEYYNKRIFSNLNIFKHLKPTLVLFIPQVATQIYTVLDKTMLGNLTNTIDEVAYYDQSQKIIRITLTVVTSVGMIMLPRIANCYANGEMNKIKDYLKSSFRFVTFLAVPISAGIFAVSKNFVPLFFGAGYDNVIILMMISSVLTLIIGMGNIFGTQYLLSTNKNKEYTLAVTVGAGVNFGINLILIPKIGALGAVIATVLAELIIALIQFYKSKEIYNNSWLRDIYKYLISGVIMLLITYSIGYILNSNIVTLIIQIVIGAVVYLGLLLILRDDLIISQLKIIKSKIVKINLNN